MPPGQKERLGTRFYIFTGVDLAFASDEHKGVAHLLTGKACMLVMRRACLA